MKELTFALNLKNNLSSPLGKAQASIESFSTGAGAAIKRLAGGAAGIWATTKSLTGLLRPASDVQSALDELSTRNVSEDALKKSHCRRRNSALITASRQLILLAR